MLEIETVYDDCPVFFYTVTNFILISAISEFILLIFCLMKSIFSDEMISFSLIS